MIALNYMLPKSDYLRMIKEIYRLFSDTKSQFTVINESDILHELGFPNEWRAQLIDLVKHKAR